MKRKRVGLAIMVVLVTLLVALPTLVGCARKEEGADRVIKIGV